MLVTLFCARCRKVEVGQGDRVPADHGMLCGPCGDTHEAEQRQAQAEKEARKEEIAQAISTLLGKEVSKEEVFK